MVIHGVPRTRVVVRLLRGGGGVELEWRVAEGNLALGSRAVSTVACFVEGIREVLP